MGTRPRWSCGSKTAPDAATCIRSTISPRRSASPTASSFVLPSDLPLGYHRVALRSGAAEHDTALIVTPAWLGLPDRLGARRCWGLTAQLYSVRSRASWGVGDLTDLTDLAVWSTARHGADFLLVNPLHAAATPPP